MFSDVCKIKGHFSQWIHNQEKKKKVFFFPAKNQRGIKLLYLYSIGNMKKK